MATPFKERINPAAITRVADALSAASPAFDRAAFITTATTGLEALELKARVEHVATALGQHLPADFGQATALLLSTLGEPVSTDAPDAAPDESGLRGFAAWPMVRFISLRGLEHPAVALPALGEITSRFTSELSIRHFIIGHPEAAWAAIDGWAEHADPHRRRLASEGTRPRLPWGIRLQASVADPSQGLKIIDRLKDDPELYVRRSVANHLNDICKDNPEIALATAERWSSGGPSTRAWVIKHGLRTLIKAADPRALALVGLPPVEVEVEGFTVAPSVAKGARLPWQATIRHAGAEEARLRVDYLLHLVRKSGKRTAKAFHVADLSLGAGEARAYDRHHDFRPISTRRYYPGTHRLELRVNGAVVAGAEFELTA